MNSLLLQTYLDAFKRIHCYSIDGKKNPAKALILYVIISLIHDEIIKDNRIKIEYIKEKYKEIQQCFNIITPYQYPYYFLESEDFYHLKWKVKRLKTKSPSTKFIRDNIEYAYLDEELWELLQVEEIREQFKTIIEDYYLSEQ